MIKLLKDCQEPPSFERIKGGFLVFIWQKRGKWLPL